MENADEGELEVAITYLNIASAKETELGAVESDGVVKEYVEKAMKILDEHENKDGYYAFVCEKCAPTFSYYGYFLTAGRLTKESEAIYQGRK